MGRFKLTFNEKWEFKYEDHTIVVTNGVDKCALIVDGKTQDVHNGLSLSASLKGKVDGKPIKASLGGLWNMNCDVFVDHEKLDLIKKSSF